LLARRVASSLGFPHGRELHVDSKDAGRLSELTDSRWRPLRAGAAGGVCPTGRRENDKARVDRVMALVKETRAHMCEPVSFDPDFLHDESGLPT
jgi:hypothetical protein